jgi:hypothetical protein
MALATAALAPAYNPGPWSAFFSLTGAAAATLTGLFFVAFSLRLQDLQLSRVVRTRARYLVLAATLSAHGSAAFDVHVPAGLDGDAVEVAASQALLLSRLVRRLASASMVSSSSASILACRSAACWAR